MTPEEILKNICAGGRLQNDALHALYQTKGAAFKRYFAHKGVHPDALKDVLQDTIVKIFKNAESYHGHGGYGDSSASAWMQTIAFSCMQDHFKKANRKAVEQTPVETLDDSGEIASGMEQRDARKRAIEADLFKKTQSADTQATAECVAAGLEDFAAEYPDRYTVLMAQMDGERIESIANRRGRTTAATKEYLSQCRKKVTSFIAHCYPLLPA
jgi:DNA-directed RNA polymerase specialized sigma24 family protein